MDNDNNIRKLKTNKLNIFMVVEDKDEIHRRRLRRLTYYNTFLFDVDYYKEMQQKYNKT